jgi:hypothetical protein
VGVLLAESARRSEPYSVVCACRRGQFTGCEANMQPRSGLWVSRWFYRVEPWALTLLTSKEVRWRCGGRSAIMGEGRLDVDVPPQE